MKQMRNASGRHQRGAVAIMVGLTIFVLIAFLGVTVDLGRLFITKTELSNAADACALAAAAELNGEADALNRAESAGITVGQRNNVGFQGSAVTILPNSDIKFSEHLNVSDEAWRTKAEITNPNEIARMKYAKCTLPQKGILPFFMQIVGLGPKDVVSHAVAALGPGITTCGLPVAMCKEPVGNTCTDPDGNVTRSDAMGLCEKQWYCSKLGSSSGSACGSGLTGSFNLVGYGGTSPNADDLAELLTGAGQCNLEIGSPATGTGAMQSLSKAWNTRFGLYQGNTGTPDYSGFAYTATSWTTKYNAFNGTSGAVKNLVAARLSHDVYQGDTASGLKTNYTSSASTGDLTSMGANRRVAVVPVVDCSTWGPSHTVTIEQFACIVMLHPWESNPNQPLYLEYAGLSNKVGSPCASVGLPGGPTAVGPWVPTLVR